MTRAVLWFVALSFFATPVRAQGVTEAQLRVIVLDQTSASIAGAIVRITPSSDVSVDIASDPRGQALFTGLTPGVVQLHVEASGFAPYDESVTLRRGNTNQTVTLKIASVAEDIVVTESSDPDERRSNAFTTTLTDEDIAGLPDDPDELQAALEEMTGGAGAVFFVDGFRGGRLPPKSDIRQIRFRQNSFAADNHDAGRVQVEIITRPGLTSWSGNANFGFRDDVLNARNAFAHTQTPEQFRRFNGSFRGPLKENTTSLRFGVDGNRSFDSGTIVAQLPDARFTDQVRRPIDQTNFTAGLEHALSKNQTLRLEYRRTEEERRNLGVGDFNLLERAYTRTRNDDQVRASLQTIIGKSALNQLRVQFNAGDTASNALSNAPAVVVIDAFSRGGASVASNQRSRTLEVANDTDFTFHKHQLRAGLLIDAGTYKQFDARNAAGTFTFGSLDAFLAAAPNTFTQRIGQVDTSFGQYQLGLYLQDDLRINRSLSLSLGVRQEMQSHLSEALNIMPRIGFTLTPRRWKTAFRGGYGLFHDWYDSNLYDQTLRVNGIAQRDLLILNPGYPDPFAGGSAVVLPGGRVQAAPDLRLPYVHQASIGAERALSQSMNVQAAYSWQRGFNQLRSRNVNAPDAFGVRPEPSIGTVTQIESTGRSATDRLMLNANYRIPQRRILVGVNYTLSRVRNDTDNALQLPADSLNPDAEWGPSSQDVRHRLFTMVNVPLPAGVRLNITSQASSAAPYTLSTGRDDNGDGVSNDRPAGVGRNSARGTARWDMSLRFSRGFGFGGQRSGEGRPNGPIGGGGGPVVVAGPGGGDGRGPGGGGGGGGFFFGGGGNNQRFNLEFYAQASNVLNRTNFANFSGNVQSPFFGTPTSAGPARRAELGLQFRF